MDEPRLKVTALELDKDARARRSMRLARSALRAYEGYLARFGDQPESYEVHSQYADLLYDLEKWSEAGREYRRVVELVPRGDRSEHAAYRRVITANSGFDCGAFEDRTTSPIPLPACAQEQLAADEMYLQYFGPAPAALKIRFRRADLLQYYKRWQEAADVFYAELALASDREGLAPFAAVRLLEVLTEAGRRDEASRWARKLKAIPRLVGDPEVRIAIAEALGETKPSKPPQSVPSPPPDVVPGAPSQPLFLPDDSDVP
jgi:tetratricopeptide (TPR) repeat protein